MAVGRKSESETEAEMGERDGTNLGGEQPPQEHGERVRSPAVHQERVCRPVGLLGERCGVDAAEALQNA